MKLVLVRHGQSVWNEKNLFTGWTDVDLSDLGQEEAKTAGKLLLENNFDFDIVYTSYLKRAIHTTNHILDEMDRNWLPVTKAWELNERHYGALQGLNKKETAEQYGEEQVNIWRRSFDVLPPALDENDKHAPIHDVMYRDIVDKSVLPFTESLKETIERAVPYFENHIKVDMLNGKNVLIVAHGNSIRGLVKYFDSMSEEAIVDVNIPTGTPLVYEFDDTMKVIRHYYLGDQDAINEKMNAVKNQAK
ncbi:2,3-diphosphoglycerate-dependent phosphoglycerate mutase [Erysipelothrix sp. HDW6A]|uniref:2,3-diphosphoglycerate-dependent phosphoglycerate mutase n=1 Tax=Erysipelothrix sp. HDW6A TaxID=2714928 RepID=UPI00140A8151|nr:2,3-diphosphoglycerate-dependent phosphoglycerate mutase [Erysipelothrix sp. HDW6A]